MWSATASASPAKVCAVTQSIVIQFQSVRCGAGPGTSLEFALQLVASLLGKEAADAVAKPMVLHFAAGETTAFFGSKGKAGKAEAKL